MLLDSYKNTLIANFAGPYAALTSGCSANSFIRGECSDSKRKRSWSRAVFSSLQRKVCSESSRIALLAFSVFSIFCFVHFLPCLYYVSDHPAFTNRPCNLRGIFEPSLTS